MTTETGPLTAPVGMPAEAAGFAETHVSWVFFTPDRAYKLLKPVEFAFLDLSDRSDRVAAAEREIELNRQFAPDVYLGAADVVESGEVVDRMIVMRRLPAGRRLAALVDDDHFSEHLDAVARRIAAIHAAAAIVAPAPMATRERVQANWTDNFTAIERSVPTVIGREVFEHVRRLAVDYLNERDALFDDRIERGYVRAGHGDLIAEDVFCLDDGPRILDCLAFDDDLRIADVLNDIAFLVMDVHRIAGAEPAGLLLRRYQEYSGERHPASLAHHYIAYRANVRTKVACLRAEQGDAPSVALARTYHDLAAHHLERARVRLVLIGGGVGTGKTTLAERVAEHYGYVHLASDDIRRDLAGIPRGEHRIVPPDTGLYAPDRVDAVYREQRREAESLLRRGHGVVLDASFARVVHRAAAARLAVDCGAELVEIECVVGPEIARTRIADRFDDPENTSDATVELVDRVAARFEPWTSAVTVDTASPPDVVATRVVGHIERGWSERP